MSDEQAERPDETPAEKAIREQMQDEARAKGIGAAVYDLAMQVARDAMAEGSTPDFRLDALKVLTGYHVGTTRVKAKQKPDDTGKSMAAVRRRLREAGVEVN